MSIVPQSRPWPAGADPWVTIPGQSQGLKCISVLLQVSVQSEGEHALPLGLAGPA